MVPTQRRPHSEVQIFLTKYFQVRARMSETEAKKTASKLTVDGDDLFLQDDEMLTDLYPIHRLGLCLYIHESDHGFVSELTWKPRRICWLL